MSSADDLILGLDCSTHAAKAIAWDLQGRAVFEARSAYELLTPQPGWYEQRAEDWLRATLRVLSEVGAQARQRLRAISITHQRETFVGLDQKGAAVRNAILWMDERAQPEVEQLRATVGEERFQELTGKPLSLTPAISKILWLRDHEPEAFCRADRWMDVQGYIVRALTGQDATSVGSADPLGLLDLRQQAWSPELLEVCAIQKRVPELLPCGSVVGTLLPAIAQMTGLSPATPVVVTAGDGQVAALGCQVQTLTHAYLNLGTAIVCGTVSPSFLLHRAFRTMAGACAGTYLLEGDLKGGTFTLDWLCNKLLGTGTSLASLEAEAARLPPGSEALVLVPYFASVMNPYWDDRATGILVGLRATHGPAHLFRSILEGIALELRLHLREIERADGNPITEIRATGGGATSPLWLRILADVLGRRIVLTATSEATSLGAAMIAAAAIGAKASIEVASTEMGGSGEVWEPGNDAGRYSRLFEEVYVHLYPSLRSSIASLSAFARSSGS